MKNYFYLILSFIFVFILIETSSFLIIKYFSNTKHYDEKQTNYIFDPQFGALVEKNILVSSRCGEGYIQTNEYGRPETPLKYENIDLKIVITGGSSIFGMGASSNKGTIASNLERTLYEEFNIKSEVVNLGVPGFTSYQEMLSIYYYFMDEKADIVISFSGYNDIAGKLQDYLIYEYNKNQKYPKIRYLIQDYFNSYGDKIKIIKDAEKGNFLVLNLKSFLILNFNTAKFLDLFYNKFIVDSIKNEKKKRFEIMESIPQEYIKVNSSLADKQARVTVMNHEMSESISKLNNANFYFFLQPSEFVAKNYDNELKTQNIKSENIKLFITESAKQMQLITDMIADRNNITNFVDFRNEIPFNKENFCTGVHSTDKGSEIIAKKIADILVNDLN